MDKQYRPAKGTSLQSEKERERHPEWAGTDAPYWGNQAAIEDSGLGLAGSGGPGAKFVTAKAPEEPPGRYLSPGVEDLWPKQDTVYGEKPPEKGPYGPYGYSNPKKDGSYDGGAGLGGSNGEWDFEALGEKGKVTAGAEGPGFRVQTGKFEGDNGGTQYGWKETGQIAKGQTEIAWGNSSVKVEGGVGTGGLEAHAGDDGFAVGAQGNAVEGAITVSSAGTSTDESVRFGLSAGEGAAVRGHWGDKDKDGFREYGFGADIGMFSFDVKSEDPIRSVVKAAAPGLLGAVEMLLPLGNLTDKAVDAAKGAVEDVQNNDPGALLHTVEANAGDPGGLLDEFGLGDEEVPAESLGAVDESTTPEEVAAAIPPEEEQELASGNAGVAAQAAENVAAAAENPSS